VHFTAWRNIDALVGLGAERLVRGAELDTGSAVLIENVVHLAVATLVEVGEVVGLIVVVASFNGGETLLVVIGGSVSRGAESTDFIDVVDVDTVGNDTDAAGLVSAREELIGASSASVTDVADVRSFVDLTVLNFRQALESVGSSNESFVANSATVGSTRVNHAVVDLGQTLVTFAGQSGEGVLALDAKTHTVILNAVGDGTGDTGAPVGGLSETVGALSADVSAGDVEVTVVDLLQTTVFNEDEVVRASLTNGGTGILAVRETSGDVSHKSTG
jgi:hypothetical protein